MVCAFVTVASFLLISRKTLFFAGLILIPSIIAYGLVNPICIGLKPILDNPEYKRINQIVFEEPDSKWIVYGSGFPPLANFTYATEAKVLNGLKYVPNLNEMKELSSKNSDFEIYNRYGHIALLPVKGPEISFKLFGQEYYLISVDPENDCWNRLGITYRFLISDKGVINLQRYPSKP